MIDLSKMDTFPDGQVPDSDVEMTLKVIRTLRDICLRRDAFDADGAILLSHAHKFIVEVVEECQSPAVAAEVSP